MTIVSLGSLSVGAAVPGMNVSIAAGTAGINASLPDLAAQLAALTAMVPTAPSFSAQLALVGQISAAISASQTAGLAMPDVLAVLSDSCSKPAELLLATAATAQMATTVNRRPFTRANRLSGRSFLLGKWLRKIFKIFNIHIFNNRYSLSESLKLLSLCAFS